MNNFVRKLISVLPTNKELNRTRSFTYKSPPSLSVPEYVTVTEIEIINSHWQPWLEKQVSKHGMDHVIKNYTVEDCIDDWIALHYAVEVV
jgi:hypothetical protein